MRMTVRQLIAKLEQVPKDSFVFVEGYEGGYSDIAVLKETKAALNVNKEEWMGPHDERPDGKVDAVVLIREWNTRTDL